MLMQLMCLLCRRWLPRTFARACQDLLGVPECELDVGLSLQVRLLATKNRSEMAALAWLMSEAVQDHFGVHVREYYDQIAGRRTRHGECYTTGDAVQVSHVATVSRDATHARLPNPRLARAQVLAAAERALRDAKQQRLVPPCGCMRMCQPRCGQQVSPTQKATARAPTPATGRASTLAGSPPTLVTCDSNSYVKGKASSSPM